MAVVIDSGPITAEDRLRDVPREKWHDLMIARYCFMQTRLSYDCRCLVQFVDDAKTMFEPLGFANAEEMIRKGYELEPEEIAIAVEWLRLHPSDGPVPYDVAKLGEHGGVRHKGEQGSSATLGRGRAYILARLKRDRPDLLEQVKAKKLSASGAAEAAGFRRKPTRFEQIIKWVPKLTADERAQLRRLLAAENATMSPDHNGAHPCP